MPIPTILVPIEKKKQNKNDKKPVGNTDPGTCAVDMETTENQEIGTQYPNTKKEVVQKERKPPNGSTDHVVYQYLGQHIPPPPASDGNTDTWYPDRPVSVNAFVYEPSRNSFIRLVLSIVLIMLMCTMGFNIYVHLMPPVYKMFQTIGIWFVLPACLIMLILNYAMACSRCAMVSPCNYFCLGLALLCMSVITAYFTVQTRTVVVLYALAATVVTVLVCVLLACSSFDFTKHMLFIIVGATVFASLSLIVLVGMLIANVYIKPLHLVILFIGTLFSVIILTTELQMIIGGKRIKLSEDDYAIGAYMVFTSIVDLFIKFLLIGHILDN